MSTYYADYTIFITDGDLAAAYQSQFPDGISVSPAEASVTYSAPIDGAATNPGEDQCIWTYGHGGGTAGLTTAVASVTIAPNFVVDAFFNLYAFSGASGGTLQWRGTFLRRGTPGPLTKEALQTHRWMNGFEHATSGEGETAGNPTQRKTRHASRTLDGLGLALRSPASETVTMTMPTTGTGFPAKNSWERFYVCLRKYPAAVTAIWGTKGSVEAGTAAQLMVQPTGQLSLYNKGNQVYPGTLGASGGQLQLNTWARIDLIFSYKATGGAGGIILYINGVEAARMIGSSSSTLFGAGGLINQIQNHSTSACGNEDATANTLEIDYDDWTNKSQPTLFTGDDWTMGSHIQPLMLTGVGAGHSGTWSNTFHLLDGVPVVGQVESMDSATANVSMEVTTNYSDQQAGCTGIQLGVFHKTASGTAETLGYAFNGGAFTMLGVTTATGTWAVSSSTDRAQTLYSAGGDLTPPALTSLNVKYTRDAVASTRAVQALTASAEFVGVWGAEDTTNLSPQSEFPIRQGPHNSPYADNMFGQTAFAAPNGLVSVMSGTYVGNGTGQDITMKQPAHWIWIRALSGSTGGSRWWSSMLSGHDPLIETPNKGNLVRCYQSDHFSQVNTSYKFRISGANANSNANGVTYQWVAFSDQAMRFCLNGAYLTLSGTASFQHNLFDSLFTPTAGFLLPELGTAAATTGMYFKGTGSAANGASLMDSAESATVCAFGAGFLTPKTIINLASTQTAYSLWRATDGSGVSGAVAITNYTGDGTGARNIALALGGRVPTFTLVQPANGVAYARDPSHTTADSHAINASFAAPSATAITAVAANQMTVGATLNAGGIVYSVFSIAGQATNPTDPIILVDPIPPPISPFGPASLNGWWTSNIQFAGAATLSTYPPINPHDARDWQKINVYALGGGSGINGGFPGPCCTVDNFMIYAGNDYSVGGTQPTIRIFDGLSDRLMITIPDVAGVKTIAIMSMMAVGQVIYLTTLDSGTSAADYAGRVFVFDPIALTLTQLGTQFTTGEVPYALCWHLGRLFMGTNKASGAVAKVYWIRPGVDTAWTTERTLSTDGVGGVQSMASFLGILYIGCNATAAMGTNKILARDPLAAYTTSFTMTSAGTFRASNGVCSMCVFNGKLYASYWNNDTTPDCYIKSFDGTVWNTVYTGTGNTVRPFIALFTSKDKIFALGGGAGLSACLLSSPDGVTWTNLTGFLTGPTGTVTATPILGQLGS